MINSINSNIGSIYNSGVNKMLEGLSNVNNEPSNTSDAFKSIFDAASTALTEVDSLQKSADTATLNFITGKDDNIHGVLLAQEKALIALQFTTEVANKSLEAYNEIMRMQI